MPFDGAGPINSLERLLAKIEVVKTEAMVDVALLGTVVPDGGWSEIAPMVELLSGRTNTYITGQTMVVDGGLTSTF